MDEQTEIQDPKAVLVTKYRRDPRWRDIMMHVQKAHRDAISFGEPGFRVPHVPGMTFADADMLAKLGVLCFDPVHLVFRLAIPDAVLEEIVLAMDAIVEEIPAEEEEPELPVSPDMVQHFEELLAKGTDMLAYFGPKINPKVEGLLHVKKAILLCLASHGDHFGDRGRIHVLMYGDPGSAKTILKDWVVYQLGAESCSQRTSKVGLTGDARTDPVTPGALPRAHRKVIGIDELDKFPNGDRQGLLEAMEEGVVHIEAGGKSEHFPAQARVIACCNRIDEFSPELLDRFDFKFQMVAPRGDEEKKIMSSIIHSWMRTKEDYAGLELKEYLKWVKPFTPEFDDATRQKTATLINIFIDLDEETRGSVRRRESILRVAYTRAKLHRRAVRIDDVLEAIKMLHPDIYGTKLKMLEIAARETEKFA